jgi:CBS domain-containing protein
LYGAKGGAVTVPGSNLLEAAMNVSEFDDAYEDQAEENILSGILSTPISELSLRKPILVEAATSVLEAVHAMREQHIGCVLVQQAENLIGIFTERDVLNRVVFHSEHSQLLVESVMTKNPESLSSSESLAFALNMMSIGGYRHIPIVDAKGKVIGVLSVQDIVAFLVDLFPAGILNLPPNSELGTAKSTDGG